MSTKDSPLHVLKAQADWIAAEIKAFERGKRTDAKFAAKLEAARGKDSFKVAISMDDKLLAIEMPWVTIRNTTELELSEFILNQIREGRG